MHFKGFLSLTLEEKELKQKQTFIVTFSCFVHSKTDLYIQRKEKRFQEKKGFQPTIPLIFFRL